MPSSVESVLIGFGLVMFVLSLFNEPLKLENWEIPVLNKTNKLVLRVSGIFLFSLGILFHVYSIKQKDNTKNKIETNNKIKITEKSVKYLIKSKGLEEEALFPVTLEIISQFDHGGSTYQTRLCRNKNNQRIIVPIKFTRCPESKLSESPFLGPLLDLTKFKR